MGPRQPLIHEVDQSLLRHATALSSPVLLAELPSLAQQHALVTGVCTGAPVAVRGRDAENVPKSNGPKLINFWSDADIPQALPDHIVRVGKEWQGDLL